MYFSKKNSATCSFQIGTKNPTKKKFIVEPSFFTSWTIAVKDAHGRTRKKIKVYMYLYIYISIWKPFRKRVYEGWRSGESTHLSPMWLEFKSRHRSHMRFSPLLRDVFPWYIYSGFPLSGKPTFPKSNCTRNVDVLPLIVVYYLLIDLFNNKVENGSHYFDLRYAVDRCCSSSA